jgi:hypothetical protein
MTVMNTYTFVAIREPVAGTALGSFMQVLSYSGESQAHAMIRLIDSFAQLQDAREKRLGAGRVLHSALPVILPLYTCKQNRPELD